MGEKIKKEYNSDKKIKDGIMTFKVKSWKGFCQCISEKFVLEEKAKTDNKYYINDYIWRGHRCESWPIQASFYRDNNHKKKKKDPYRHINSFAYAARGKLEEFGIKMRDFKDWIGEDPERIKHFWALGRHYGLETPLLDWTTSPFIAAFFAFGEENTLEDLKWINAKNEKEKIKLLKDEEYEDRCVFGIKYKEMAGKLPLIAQIYRHLHKRDSDTKQETHIRKQDFKQLFHHHNRPDDANEKTHQRKSDIEYLFEYFDPMSSEHKRLIDQRGLFTKTKDGEDIESIVKKYWEKEYTEPWLIKIVIPSNKENREEFLRGLNVMNINSMTLFSEIEGSAKFCNTGLEFEGYSIFPGQGT